jgi:hypothetical protein
VALLFAAIRLIPFELGLRFLTDHLQGDRWFRVSAPGQNLAKARIQFALVADIERKEAGDPGHHRRLFWRIRAGLTAIPTSRPALAVRSRPLFA